MSDPVQIKVPEEGDYTHQEDLDAQAAERFKMRELDRKISHDRKVYNIAVGALTGSAAILLGIMFFYVKFPSENMAEVWGYGSEMIKSVIFLVLGYYISEKSRA